MMRINLLGARRSRRLASADRPLVAMGAAVVLSIAGMLYVTMSANADATQAIGANNAVRSDIERVKGELGDFEKVKAERQSLLKQQKTILELKKS